MKNYTLLFVVFLASINLFAQNEPSKKAEKFTLDQLPFNVQFYFDTRHSFRLKDDPYHADKLVETKTATSFKGYVIFNLSPAFYTKNNYNFMIETLGISKKIENPTLYP